MRQTPASTAFYAAESKVFARYSLQPRSQLVPLHDPELQIRVLERLLDGCDQRLRRDGFAYQDGVGCCDVGFDLCTIRLASPPPLYVRLI